MQRVERILEVKQQRRARYNVSGRIIHRGVARAVSGDLAHVVLHTLVALAPERFISGHFKSREAVGAGCRFERRAVRQRGGEGRVTVKPSGGVHRVDRQRARKLVRNVHMCGERGKGDRLRVGERRAARRDERLLRRGHAKGMRTGVRNGVVKARAVRVEEQNALLARYIHLYCRINARYGVGHAVGAYIELRFELRYAGVGDTAVRDIFLAESDAVDGDSRAFRHSDGERAHLGVQRVERRGFNFPRAAGFVVACVQTQEIIFSGGEDIDRRAARSVPAVQPEGKALSLHGGVEEISGDGFGAFKSARLRRAEGYIGAPPCGGIGGVEKLLHGVLRRDRRERAGRGEVHPCGCAADKCQEHKKADQKKR